MSASQEYIDAVVVKYSSIPKTAFQVTVGVFYGLAVLSVVARGVIRVMTRRKLAFDDYLLFIAFAFLTASTGIIYHLCEGFYLATAIMKEPVLFMQFTSEQVQQVLDNALNQNIFLSVAWTATFFVKFSFLAFFKQLIWQVDKIQYYYWSVVILTILTWMFLTSEAFINCSDFGIDSLKCFSASKTTLYIAMTGLITGLDALTDILIVSIPVIVLHRAKMRTSQKISLGLFLCLSLVMVIVAIIRASKIKSAISIDVIWEFYWQYMETVIAVIMGSITVIRNLVVHQNKASNKSPVAAADNLGQRGKSSYRMRFLHRYKKEQDLESRDELPEVPGATITGLRTFIRRNNRETGLDTQQSNMSTLAEDEDSYKLIAREPISTQKQQFGSHVEVTSAPTQPAERIYQSWHPTRPQGWASLRGDTMVHPSATTSRTGTTLNERDDY